MDINLVYKMNHDMFLKAFEFACGQVSKLHPILNPRDHEAHISELTHSYYDAMKYAKQDIEADFNAHQFGNGEHDD